jgi:hypothetical protein
MANIEDINELINTINLHINDEKLDFAIWRRLSERGPEYQRHLRKARVPIQSREGEAWYLQSDDKIGYDARDEVENWKEKNKEKQKELPQQEDEKPEESEVKPVVKASRKDKESEDLLQKMKKRGLSIQKRKIRDKKKQERLNEEKKIKIRKKKELLEKDKPEEKADGSEDLKNIKIKIKRKD